MNDRPDIQVASLDYLASAVEQTWHTYDSQRQILASRPDSGLGFRQTSFKRFEVFPLCLEAVADELHRCSVERIDLQVFVWIKNTKSQ